MQEEWWWGGISFYYLEILPVMFLESHIVAEQRLQFKASVPWLSTPPESRVLVHRLDYRAFEAKRLLGSSVDSGFGRMAVRDSARIYLGGCGSALGKLKTRMS